MAAKMTEFAHDAASVIQARSVELYHRVSAMNASATFGPDFGQHLSVAVDLSLQTTVAWSKVGYALATALATFLYDNPEVAVILLLLVLLYILTKLVGRALSRLRLWLWNKQRQADAKFQAYRARMAEKSRWLALLLPDLIFTTIIATACIFPKPRQYLSSPNLGFALGVILPWLFSVAALIPLDDDVAAEAGLVTPRRPGQAPPAELRKAQAMMADMKWGWLTYWATLGLFFTVTEIPVLRHFLPLLPYYQLVQCVIVLWLLVPFVNGSATVRDAWLKLIVKVSPLFSQGTTKVEATTPLIRTMAGFVMPAALVERIAQFLAGGYILLLAVPFFFSPRFVLHFGCALVGVLAPAHVSLSLDPSRGESAPAITEWLQYWIIFVLFHLAHELLEVRMEVLPFWYDLEMLALLYLQLPAYRGAVTLATAVVNSDNVQALLTPLTPARSVIQRRRASRPTPLPATSLPATPTAGNSDPSVTPMVTRARPRPPPSGLRRRVGVEAKSTSTAQPVATAEAAIEPETPAATAEAGRRGADKDD